MKLIIKGSSITMVEGGTLIQNDKTPCSVEFVFLDCWVNFPSKTALFKAGNADEVSVSLTENKCLIPDACLKEGGVFLKACIKGSNDTDGISTSWCILGRVLYDASIDTIGGGGTGGGGGENTYVLPVATRDCLGGVKIGDNVSVESDGTISVQANDLLDDVVASYEDVNGMLANVFDTKV